MAVTEQTETAYVAFIESQVELRDTKEAAKQQITVLQSTGEAVAREAKNQAYNNASQGNEIRDAVAASKAAFAPYKEQIAQVNARIAELGAQSDAAWKAYEVARGIGA